MTFAYRNITCPSPASMATNIETKRFMLIDSVVSLSLSYVKKRYGDLVEDMPLFTNLYPGTISAVATKLRLRILVRANQARRTWFIVTAVLGMCRDCESIVCLQKQQNASQLFWQNVWLELVLIACDAMLLWFSNRCGRTPWWACIFPAVNVYEFP